MAKATASDIDELIRAGNANLKATGVRLRVERRGGALSLRGMFPPKTGEGKWKQQYLSLGVDATVYGVKQALRKASEIDTQLENRAFNWENWGNLPQSDTCKDWIERYRKDWFQKRGDTPHNQKTWHVHEWNQALKLLPGDEPLTAQVLIKACKSKTENTRSRELCCQTLQRFAKFAGVEVDLIALKGSYKNPKERKIPSDEQIIEALNRITNPHWALVFKCMAVYGLRDHEVWHCEIEAKPPYACRVLEGKTALREGILPLYPGWAKQWEPWKGELPSVTFKGDRRIYSDRTSKAFKRFGVGFPPYSLRHAWCLRGTIRFKLPVPTMALMAGHSPEVHLKTYNRWLSAEMNREIYLQAISNPSAPKAPAGI